jgi:hypothetical protein
MKKVIFEKDGSVNWLEWARTVFVSFVAGMWILELITKVF